MSHRYQTLESVDIEFTWSILFRAMWHKIRGHKTGMKSYIRFKIEGEEMSMDYFRTVLCDIKDEL